MLTPFFNSLVTCVFCASLWLKLRADAIQHPRERDRLANVFDATHPGRASLYSHPKSTMRHTAVATQIQIPIKRLLRQSMQRNLLLQKLERRGTLTATDNLAITF